ncbi:MAG: hypothetical protein JW822_12235 [Spirochaetales bacterium]|nr:hypothetical protein [Spirochaetales bacterium]
MKTTQTQNIKDYKNIFSLMHGALACLLCIMVAVSSCDLASGGSGGIDDEQFQVLFYNNGVPGEEIAQDSTVRSNKVIGESAPIIFRFSILNTGGTTLHLNENQPLSIGGRDPEHYRILSHDPGFQVAPETHWYFLLEFDPQNFGNHLVRVEIATETVQHAFSFYFTTDVLKIPEAIEERFPLPLGDWNSIATDDQNNAHVVYHSDEFQKHLKYATNKSGQWEIEIIDTTAVIGEFNDIAVDHDGYVHIVYYNYNYREVVDHFIKFGGLRYATNKNGLWTITDVHLMGDCTTFGADIHIEIGADNAVYVAFWNQVIGRIQMGTNASGSWQFRTFDDPGASVLRQFGYALDAHNKSHLFYMDGNTYDVKYATDKNGAWQYSLIDNVGSDGLSWGFFPVVDTDASCHAHLAYRNWLKLKYASDASGVWEINSITTISERAPFYISLAIDSLGCVHISHVEFLGDLLYSTNTNGQWATHLVAENVNDEGSGDKQFASITVDSLNDIHIAYNNSDEGIYYFSD